VTDTTEPAAARAHERVTPQTDATPTPDHMKVHSSTDRLPGPRVEELKNGTIVEYK